MPDKCRGLINFWVIINFLILLLNLNFTFSNKNGEFSLIDDENLYFFHGDYSPPPPLPPSLPPLPPSVNCEGDLKGFGSLDSLCKLNSSLEFLNDVYIEGNGSLYIEDGVRIICPIIGCLITVNLSGEFHLGRNAYIRAGALWVKSTTANLLDGSKVNVSAMASSIPEESTGTPTGLLGAGGGHGGRGANCLYDNTKLPEDVWGGDAYAWSELSEPWSFGCRGGTTSREFDFGGYGGGRIWFNLTDSIDLSGSLLADGGNVGAKGGGGAGGSVFIMATKMYVLIPSSCCSYS